MPAIIGGFDLVGDNRQLAPVAGRHPEAAVLGFGLPPDRDAAQSPGERRTGKNTPQ
jgi:hypothetical protein